MRKARIISLAVVLSLLALSGCTAPGEELADVEEESSLSESSKAPEVVSDEEPEQPSRWMRDNHQVPPPLTYLTVSQKESDLFAVEATVTDLFELPDGERDFSTQYYLLGENLAVHMQQEELLVVALSGRELARIPCRGVNVLFGSHHFSIVDTEEATVTIYDEWGMTFASFSTEGMEGVIQTIQILPDESGALLIKDSEAGGGYEILWVDLPGGTPRAIDLELDEDMQLTYQLEIPGDGSIAVFTAYKPFGSGTQWEEWRIYYDTEIRQVIESVIVPEERFDGETYIPAPSLLTTASHLIFEVSQIELAGLSPAIATANYENEVYFFYDGAILQLCPLTGSGRVGYFPLYSYRLIGMEDEDRALVAYSDSGTHWIARIAMDVSYIDKPEPGVDFSQESLESLEGQELRHNGRFYGDTYSALSAIVTQYTDLFAQDGYALPNTPETANRVYQYLLFSPHKNLGLPAVMPQYEQADGTYVFPSQVVEDLASSLFQMESYQLDLRQCESYSSQVDSYLYLPGAYGIGEHDQVFVQSASYQDGVLDLTLRILPSAYRSALNRDSSPEQVRMVIGYDLESGDYCYNLVQIQ